MKRICFFIAVLGLFALGFTSCSKDVEKCWKVDITLNVESMEMTVTNYIWATENDLEYHINNLKEEYIDEAGIEMTIKKSVTKIKTEEACDDENESIFDF